MTDREKLIELLLSGEKTVQCEHSPEVNCDGMKCAFCERVEIADRLIANGVTFATDTNDGGEWINVEDKLPVDVKPVLAYYGFRNGDGVGLGTRFTGPLSYFGYNQNPHWQHESTGLVVTHWMPLPEPPEEE